MRYFIRDAMEVDLHRLVEMGEKFHGETDWKDIAAFDQVSYENTCRMLIEEENGILLIARNGMIGGMVYPLWFNQEHRTSQELLWYCEDGHARPLIEAFENRVREMGASSMMMQTVSPMTSSDRLYPRLGYKQLEAIYIKECG